MKTVVPEDGFTLVELLVTMAILALLTIYALSAFSSLRQFNAIAARIEEQENIDAVHRFLSSSLEDMRMNFRSTDDGAQAVVFSGKSDRIMFLTVANGEREIGGIYEVSVYRDANGDLLMDRQMREPKAAAAKPPAVLLTDVAEVSFSYRGCEASQGAQSVPDWSDPLRLPKAVEISVRFTNKPHWRWRILSAEVAATSC